MKSILFFTISIMVSFFPLFIMKYWISQIYRIFSHYLLFAKVKWTMLVLQLLSGGLACIWFVLASIMTYDIMSYVVQHFHFQVKNMSNYDNDLCQNNMCKRWCQKFREELNNTALPSKGFFFI